MDVRESIVSSLPDTRRSQVPPELLGSVGLENVANAFRISVFVELHPRTGAVMMSPGDRAWEVFAAGFERPFECCHW